MQDLKAILKEARKYVEKANHDAECKHDDMDGEYYLDSVQYEIMQETDELLKRIDEATLSGT